MKYLVTGGSGFLGINIIRFLLNKGESVVSLDVLPFDYEEASKITSLVGDIRDEKDVRAAMDGVDIVIHTAAALPLYTKEEISSIDIDGTKLLLQISRQNKIKRFVHISSTAVYGIPDHHPLLETDPLIGVGPYGEAKIEAEKLCIEYRESGMCVPILRPKSFIGPERLGVFALFYDWAADGRNFPMIGSGNNRYQLLDVEDLCEAIYLCATKDRTIVNDTFNVGAKEFTTMKEDYQAVLDHVGKGKRIIGMPAWPVINALRLLEVLKLSPLYKWVYETAHKDSFVSIEKAEKILGFSPKYSNKESLIRNFDWYMKNKDQFKNTSGITHRVPWKQGLLGVFKHLF